MRYSVETTVELHEVVVPDGPQQFRLSVLSHDGQEREIFSFHRYSGRRFDTGAPPGHKAHDTLQRLFDISDGYRVREHTSELQIAQIHSVSAIKTFLADE